MAAVHLEHVSKVYPPAVRAVRDLTLSVGDGELLVLVGPSGCGKTTTLRLIAGLETPTEGTVAIGGRDVTRLPPRERNVAMVFQRPAVYPHLSVRDNLAFGLRLQRPGFRFFRRATDEPDIPGRVAEVARLLQMEDVLDRRADRLSGGQQQRVALGRAVARRPAVFLLDEPLSQLDLPLRLEMRRELHLLHKRLPATMIYVTHDPVEALTLADRVAVLDAGALQQVDTPQAVYRRPVNRRVAGFLGEVPMNLLDGEIVQAEGRQAFRAKDGALTVPLPAEWAEVVRPQAQVKLGVRPEHLGLLTDGGTIGAGESSLAMDVALVEPAGASCLLTLQRGGLRLTAVTDGRQTWSDGQKVGVVIDMDRTHLFDGASGQALAHGRATG